MSPSGPGDDELYRLPTGPALVRGLTLACAVCGQRRGVVLRWFGIAETCPRCGLRFARIEGHWLGSLGINTVLSFGALFVTVVVGFLVTWPDPPVLPLVIVAVAVGLIVPLVLLPLSRTLWTAIDLLARPPRRSEIPHPPGEAGGDAGAADQTG